MNAKARTSGPVRRARWLIAAVLVVVAFLGVNIIAQMQARKIDRLAYDLETDAVPSINHLSAARGDLQRLTIAARDLVRDGAAGRPLDRGPYEEERTRLDANMAGYAELPVYPGEAALHQLAAKEIGVYESALNALMGRLNAGDVARASMLVDDEVMPANDRVAQHLQQLVELNTTEISQASEAIRNAREGATKLSYTLHGLAASLAVLALWAVARSNRTYEKLVEARARLENERKEVVERRAAELDMFAARVAHDLKNPLGAIALGVEAAARKAEDPGQVRKSLGRANNSIRHAKEIIDGLLAFARAGGEVTETASVNLAEAIESVIAQMAPETERAGTQLVVEPLPSSIYVACTEGPLLSVLGNLLGNAVKYVSEPSVAIRRVRVQVVEKGVVARIEIEDTGPGIPVAVQERIFEPYVRGPDTHQPGLGLGLATVKRIVEAHGGSVGVESTVGRGCCFWCELPRAAEQVSARQRHQPELH